MIVSNKKKRKKGKKRIKKKKEEKEWVTCLWVHAAHVFLLHKLTQVGIHLLNYRHYHDRNGQGHLPVTVVATVVDVITIVVVIVAVRT